MATLSEARAQLAAWEAASLALAAGKEHWLTTAGGARRLMRSDAEEVTRMIDHWQTKVNRLQSPTGAIPFAVAAFPARR